MLRFYPVSINRELNRNNPLYVGHFFRLKGMWWEKRKQRQGLIISIAIAWYRLVKNNPTAPGFVTKETFLTHLTKQVTDARKALDYFFKVEQIGYNFGNGIKNPSIITPKRLSKEMLRAVKAILDELEFHPGLIPTDETFVKSIVNITDEAKLKAIALLKENRREDLIPAVAWLIKQPSPITFYFKPSGTLQARDTSVWPIRAIETWPGWLRQTLFGIAIDIESAYPQFLIEHLSKKYSDSPQLLKLLYPDIIRMNVDKLNFRLELLQLMKLDNNKENMKIVKSVLMSLANGSKASAALMLNGTHCEVANLLRESNSQLTHLELIKVGNRLAQISKQLQIAKKDLCTFILKSKPSRENQKRIFQIYLEWEREARYKIWEASGKTGIMMHDGTDGAMIDSPEKFQKLMMNLYNLKVSISV